MSDTSEQVLVLVDEQDNIVGYEDKIAAHRSGQLHRAFSIFIFDSNDQILLQQRAVAKYHSGGLWANSCCGHPGVEEDCPKAASRRLEEELGFTTPLKFLFKTRYQAKVSHDMSENELVYIYSGRYDGKLKPCRSEVMDLKWCDWNEFIKDISLNPCDYSAWLRFYMKAHAHELSPLA